MKLKSIDILLYAIGGLMGAIIFLIAVLFISSEYVQAAETPPTAAEELEQQEVESLYEILERLEEMREQRAEYETETKTFMEKVQTFFEAVNQFISGESNALIWLIAIQAFHVAVSVVLIFAVVWRVK